MDPQSIREIGKFGCKNSKPNQKPLFNHSQQGEESGRELKC
jgi:hypothetical protein